MKLQPIDDVLIVEDRDFDTELILRAIRVHAPDLKLSIVASGAAAVEYLEINSPKVILLDLQLPDVDGCELLRWIRTDHRHQRVPVMILTASSDDRLRSEAHRLGISAYINKTADLHTLADHLTLFKHFL